MAALPKLPWEKFEKLKKPHKLGIWVGTLVVLAAAWFFLMWQPMTTEIINLQEDIDKLDSRVLELQRTARDLNKITEQLEEIRRQFEMTKELLPESQELPTLIRSVSGHAKESGLNVTLFKPSGQETIQEFYAEVPFEINIEGPFLNQVSFFFKVGSLPRIVSFTGVKMGSPMVIGDDMILKTACEGITYRFLTPEEIEAQEEAKKAAAKKKK